jgi:hypothetical protein
VESDPAGKSDGQRARPELTDAWFLQARNPLGIEVPASVVNQWHRYVRIGDLARKRHAGLELLSLVVTAAVPACAAFGVPAQWIGLLGALAVVLHGTRQLTGWKESWVNRKRVRYAIEREVALFRVGAERYVGEDAAVRLVECVEDIIAEEREDWHARRVAYDGNVQRTRLLQE